MNMLLRFARWFGIAVLVLLAARGAFALFLDALRTAASIELRYVTPGVTWTAFEKCVDHDIVADRDTWLYLARAVDDESTWIRIAPTDTHLHGPMEWKGPDLLRVPARFRDGCLRRIDDVVIEWELR